MDLDIEMGDAVEGMSDQLDDLEEPGEVAEDEPAATGERFEDDERKILVPTKVHIRGVDTLHTTDINAYVKTHFGPVDKVEWINDSSANLVFSNENAAREAIASLSAMEITDVTALGLGESLPAKIFQGKPDINLQVRLAMKSDRKQAGAALRSRYYLLHPEHDPEERRRGHQENRSRYRDREGDYGGKVGRYRRGADDEVETFEASMYDDAPRYRHERHSSRPDRGTRLHAENNAGKELLAYRAYRRDRSASPQRVSGSDNHADVLDRSSRQNRAQARAIQDRMTADNSSKELFPTKSSWSGGRLDQLEESIGSARLQDEDMPKVVKIPQAQVGSTFNIRGLAVQKGNVESSFTIKGAASANARELFPDKLGTPNTGKELLESTRNNRRQKAQDLFF
ncbi:hypothetical protein QQS21_001025 [Conoideocrella luteorostrata]|uniref:Uncharacterized protein n=1 Tax=Conoideocrella luteorostrata TaxID=1105319 RepID=A0AAJ0G2B8_9HYPO|nr:hypothetical protein QQS21_001025 [Conoideocrella luteorostrata]